MATKRPLPALPIFNKGKRPKHALIAHPNNQGGISHEAIGLKSQCYGRSDQNSEQEYRNPSFQPHQHVTYGKSKFTPFHYGQRLTLQSHHETQYGNKEMPLQYSFNQPLTPSMGNAYAQAQEPIEAAQTNNSSSETVNRRPRQQQELRVLTATAQGVEHWSQYRQHTQLLFEVFGILVSITKCSNLSQQFTIKTTDGLLECIFWKMEHPFPAVAQRQVVRVVGEWETQNRRLRCYSVRLANLNEEEDVIKQCVMAADRHMRRLVERL